MEKILCAAIYFDNGIEYLFGQQCISGHGFVIGGFSHDEIRKSKQAIEIKTNPDIKRVVENEGFLTTYNRFVNRKTAATIAYCAKQIKKETLELISTDLIEKDLPLT